METDEIRFYDAIRQMEQSKVPFSVTWGQYSLTDQSKGGQLHMLDNVLYRGRKKTDNYELILFELPDGTIENCHLYSILTYNGKKLMPDE